MEDNGDEDIDQLNLGEDEVKVDLYNENENENDISNSGDKSKNENSQVVTRYTIVDNNFEEDNSRENSIRTRKDNSNLLNENDVIINDSGAHSKRESKNIERVSLSFIDLKIILLGDAGVGKTSISGRYIDSTFKDNYQATIQVEKRMKIINEDDKTSVRLNIWDTAGQEKFRSITRQFYRDCHGAFIVFDLTKKSSFNELKNWMDELKTHGNDDTVIIILANKSDLTTEREISEEEIKNKINNKYKYFEVSAKTGNNISLAFDEMKKLIMQKIKKNEEIENNLKSGKKKLSKEEKRRAQSLDEIKETVNKQEAKCC
jgi:small GTP-binding protein